MESLQSLLQDMFKLEVHASLRAEELFSIPLPFIPLSLTITNSTLMAWAAMLVLAIFAVFAGRNPQLVPRGAQNAFEAIIDGLQTIVENTAGHYARRVFPLAATLFIFILTANYMGMLPGVGTILVRNAALAHEASATASASESASHAPTTTSASGEEAEHEPEMIPLLRAANADVNMTLGMGLIAFLFIHYSGIAVHGLRGYWKEDLANPPLMAPIKIIIECFVPVSLSMRLFGNIFGGEMLLTVMGFPFIAVPFMVMELLFGLIQATIFFMLTLIFTSLASHLPGGHEGHAGHEATESHATHGPEEVHHAGTGAGTVPAAA